MSIAVVHGDFRWARGFGFADLENRVPATAESSYRMASVSKPMTAVAVLKLATRELAWSRQPTRDGKPTDYGLGFGIDTRGGRTVVAHTGAQQETRTALMIVPDAKLVIALASNFENAQLKVFADKIMDLFLGK